jgi:Domain of unknown function (DUF4276)
VKVTIYFEGGGDGGALKTLARKGLKQFIGRMGFYGRMPGIVACGSRNDTYDRFCVAMRTYNSGVPYLPILLVDSEDQVSTDDIWSHLYVRDKWKRPSGADDVQAHVMVRCMETWFLADVDALKRYFGNRFSESALPRHSNIEDIDRKEISDALHKAARNTPKEGYNKGRDSFRVLAELDPAKVIAASSHAKRLFETLKKHL